MAPEINWQRYGTRNYVTVTSRIMGLIQRCSTEHWDITATAVSRACRAFQFAIRIDSFCKTNRPIDSLVVMQFFLLIYCIVSAKKVS